MFCLRVRRHKDGMQASEAGGGIGDYIGFLLLGVLRGETRRVNYSSCIVCSYGCVRTNPLRLACLGSCATAVKNFMFA